MAKTTVPFWDFSSLPTELTDAWKDAVAAVMASGQFIGGEDVTAFEEAWASYVGAKHCIGVGNGLDALTIALRALSLDPGSPVLVPAHTFIATWLSVLAAGLVPIGVDVNAQGQIDVASIRDRSAEASAVIAVHMHGIPADISALTDWAIDNDIPLLEDCAQAHGLRTFHKHVGTWGTAGAFSFYPTKNLGAIGDAGAVVTNSDAVAARVRSLANYGSSPQSKYIHEQLGVNSRLDPLQARVLHHNLSLLDHWNQVRRAVADRYLDALRQAKNPALRPLATNTRAGVWHHFVVVCDDREKFTTHLKKEGVDFEVHYPRVAAHEIAQMTNMPTTSFPMAERLATSAVSLPLHPWLTNDQVGLVEGCLSSFSG